MNEVALLIHITSSLTRSLIELVSQLLIFLSVVAFEIVFLVLSLRFELRINLGVAFVLQQIAVAGVVGFRGDIILLRICLIWRAIVLEKRLHAVAV